ncbi:MAG: 4Fe-4S dicluster domain-containing protein [Erysipelotrichaceae bacterium]
MQQTLLHVNHTRCPQNHACPSVNLCPVDALSQEGFAAPVVDMDRCIQCGRCVSFCPMGALTLQKINP